MIEWIEEPRMVGQAPPPAPSDLTQPNVPPPPVGRPSDTPTDTESRKSKSSHGLIGLGILIGIAVVVAVVT